MGTDENRTLNDIIERKDHQIEGLSQLLNQVEQLSETLMNKDDENKKLLATMRELQNRIDILEDTKDAIEINKALGNLQQQLGIKLDTIKNKVEVLMKRKATTKSTPPKSNNPRKSNPTEKDFERERRVWPCKRERMSVCVGMRM